MLIRFPEDIKRGSSRHFGPRDARLGACLLLNWWRVFPNHNRIFVLIRNLLTGDPFSCQEQRPLAALWRHWSHLDPYLVAYVALDTPLLLQYSLFCSSHSLLRNIWRLVQSRTSMGSRTCCGCGCGRTYACASSRSRSGDARNRCPDSRSRYENSRKGYYARDLEVSPWGGNPSESLTVQSLFNTVGAWDSWRWFSNRDKAILVS